MNAQQLDIITTLPQPIIDTILCLLPIKDAAMTSILSREWRHKWTTIPKVECKSFIRIKRERKNMCMSFKAFYALEPILLQRQGHEFILSVLGDTCLELDRIILHLSRNHPIKKLTLDFSNADLYRLPLSLFSLHHITELNLDSCDLVHQPPFNNGFRSLTSLSLNEVMMSKESLLHLLSNCPSLKILSLVSCYLYVYSLLLKLV
ncbi:F-box/FBD/LRR-repeat protein At1g13570-like [Bidens hawaiensis]|uniref:F-box/FBD/LRR-repeat protein At1g13570-like n=1 Tax=Bidens hawaiensis TaxID=980011 RepID=UPI00404A7FE6